MIPNNLIYVWTNPLERFNNIVHEVDSSGTQRQ
jgi:hypothetical protein